jgi:hypothetical protein
MLAPLLTALSLTGCVHGSGGDVGCTWTKPITLTPDQIQLSTEGPMNDRRIQPAWRSHYEDLFAHNQARKERCG